MFSKNYDHDNQCPDFYTVTRNAIFEENFYFSIVSIKYFLYSCQFFLL